MKHLVFHMSLRLVPCCRNNVLLCDPERPDDLDKKENELDAADDGEPTQESHGASDQTQLGVELDFFVSFYFVEGCRVEEDLDQVKRGFWNLFH